MKDRKYHGVPENVDMRCTSIVCVEGIKLCQQSGVDFPCVDHTTQLNETQFLYNDEKVCKLFTLVKA